MASGEKNMCEAIRQIEQKAQSAKFSTIYETDPIGEHKHAKYKNCVGQIHTTESFEEWQLFFKSVEKTYGRTPELRTQGNVPIDLDIVIWNEEVKRPKDLAAEFLRKGLDELGRS